MQINYSFFVSSQSASRLKFEKIFAPTCNSSFLLTTFFLVTFLLVGFTSFSQRTEIPDANFRRVLLDDYGISADSDNTILNSDAVAVTSLNISKKEISNLSGIEAFTSLIYLSCTDNSLTTLDVSANTALTSLSCERNSSLSTLNVSGATALTILRCYSNSLSILDVSTNIRLTQLLCANNSLNELAQL